MPILCISGNIAAGKTTLTRALSQHGWIPLEEQPDINPFLGASYANPKRYALCSQFTFMLDKYRLLRNCPPNRPVVVERWIEEDALFARFLYQLGYMREAEWEAYEAGYEFLKRELPPVDLVVYLHCPYSVARERILWRGRPYEANLPSGYWLDLQELYESWVSRWDTSPVLRVDTSKCDLLSDAELERLVASIQAQIHLPFDPESSVRSGNTRDARRNGTC